MLFDCEYRFPHRQPEAHIFIGLLVYRFGQSICIESHLNQSRGISIASSNFFSIILSLCMAQLKFLIRRIDMSESLPNHAILCECLAFSEGKTRIMSIGEKSKLLSILALLLNGDSLGTAVYVHRVERVVLVVRNKPITAIDERCFDRFFRQIRVYANPCFDKEKARIVSDVDAQLRSRVFWIARAEWSINWEECLD